MMTMMVITDMDVMMTIKMMVTMVLMIACDVDDIDDGGDGDNNNNDDDKSSNGNDNNEKNDDDDDDDDNDDDDDDDDDNNNNNNDDDDDNNNIELGAGIAQLVVLGLAVHSVAGSILLWGHFPVEGIFPLEFKLHPPPPKLLRMRV